VIAEAVMERHLSTGVATIVALMAAQRSAAYEKPAPATCGQDNVGGIETNAGRTADAQSASSTTRPSQTNHRAAYPK